MISRKALKDAVQQHRDLEGPLDTWYRVTKKADWTSLDDIRNTWRDTDGVGVYTVFNIKGNHYRLITKINYRSKIVFIRCILTHAEYDKDKWKK